MKRILLAVMLVIMLAPLVKGDITYTNELGVGDNQVVFVYGNYDVTVIKPDNTVFIPNKQLITSGVYRIEFKVDIKGMWQIVYDNNVKVFNVKEVVKTLTIQVTKNMLPASSIRVEIYHSGQLIYTDFTNDNGLVILNLPTGIYKISAGSKDTATVDLNSQDYVSLEVGEGFSVPYIGKITYAMIGATVVVVILLVGLYKVLTKKGGR